MRPGHGSWSVTALVMAPALALLTASAARAQELSYEVTPEAEQVLVGQGFVVTCDIVVSGAEIEAVSLPETGALDLVGQSRSEGTQVSIVNGRLSSSRTVRITLTLRAAEPGTYEIGPGEVRAEGKVARSAPVKIEVVDAGAAAPAPPPAAGAPTRPAPGAAAPPPIADPGQSEKLFLVLSVAQGEVYLGQQLSVTLTLYSRLDLSDIRGVRLPDFEGVVVEDLVTPRRVSPQPQQIGGRRYHAFMLRKLALFPTRSGLLVLPPAEVTAVVGGGFFQRGQLVRRESEPLEVMVKPLPVEERPADFEPGNVGAFGLEVKVNRRRLSQRDPLNLTVTVIGQGNFRALRVPQLSAADGFRVYQPTTFEETRVERDAIHGRKGYEVLLQPQRAGRLVVPPLRLDFFDPDKGRYQTVRSDSIPVEVSPWTGAQGPGPGLPDQEEGELPARPVRVSPSLDAPAAALGARLFASAVAGLQLGILGLLVAGRVLRSRRRSPRVTHLRALAAARRAMLAAAGEGDVDALAPTLDRYLSEVLRSPVTGLTREALAELLGTRGFDPAATTQLNALLDAIEARRYAPSGSAAGELARPARSLARSLEAALAAGVAEEER